MNALRVTCTYGCHALQLSSWEFTYRVAEAKSLRVLEVRVCCRQHMQRCHDYRHDHVTRQQLRGY